MELLDSKTVHELKQVFTSFAGTDGYVGPDELGLVLRAIGVASMTRAEIDELLSQIDSTGKGKLDFPAFSHLLCS